MPLGGVPRQLGVPACSASSEKPDVDHLDRIRLAIARRKARLLGRPVFCRSPCLEGVAELTQSRAERGSPSLSPEAVDAGLDIAGRSGSSRAVGQLECGVVQAAWASSLRGRRRLLMLRGTTRSRSSRCSRSGPSQAHVGREQIDASRTRRATMSSSTSILKHLIPLGDVPVLAEVGADRRGTGSRRSRAPACLPSKASIAPAAGARNNECNDRVAATAIAMVGREPAHNPSCVRARVRRIATTPANQAPPTIETQTM